MINNGMKQVRYSLEEYGKIFGVVYLIGMFKDKEHELKCTIAEYKQEIAEIPTGDILACLSPLERWLYAEALNTGSRQLKRYENELWRYGNNLNILLGRKIDNDDSIDIDLVKSVPIESLLDIEPMRISGKRAYYVCPLHEETDASFIVYRKTNSFYCHGCHAGGDIISLYIELNGFDKEDPGSFRKACKEILKLT